MKASFNWLKDFVDFDYQPREIAHMLTMAGLEVEAMEELDGDTVFEIGITPNRPDCLNIRGIARELSAIMETELKDISGQIEKTAGQGPPVEIESPDLCPRYSGRIITGVKPGPSPEWLSKRLESCGIRSTLNIVDVTNYVMLELGQPMHAFDLDSLSGKRIVVKKAGAITTFTTLDNEERNISGDTLLIWDGERPVAVAGIMGGQNTEVSDKTVNILLESAYFNPASIRRSSKYLNLSTESSYRFERGIDIEAVTFALDRASQLIAEIAGGDISELTDNYPVPYASKTIDLSFQRVNSVIGLDIDESFVEETLFNLGFNFIGNDGGISVTPPSFRNDVERDLDLIEEIARIYGYDKIPSTLPVMQMSAPPEHKKQEIVKTLKNLMIKAGFSEAINYSFLNPETLDALNLTADDRRRNLLYVRNPLRKEDSALRTTLVPALLNNVSLNLNRGERMLRLFEISSVFFSGDRKLPDEVVQLVCVNHKGQKASLWESSHDGFYDVKGAVENTFSALRITGVSFTRDSQQIEPYLHPGKSCAILLDNERIGSIGVLHPRVAEAFDIKGDISLAEIYDMERVLEAVNPRPSFSPLPRYPYVERDISILVDDGIAVSDIREEILNVDSAIIEAVNVFDIYKGKSIPENQKSIGFSIRYRSSEKTLTDSEVDELHSTITERLQKTLKAELRS